MQEREIITPAAAVIVSVLMAPSLSAEPGWYLGLGVGRGEVEVVGHDRRAEVAEILTAHSYPQPLRAAGEHDNTDTASLYAGYRFSRYRHSEFSIEASYQQLGDTDGRFDSVVDSEGFSLSGRLRSRYRAVAITAVARWPASSRWSLLAKFGAHYWQHRFQLQAYQQQVYHEHGDQQQREPSPAAAATGITLNHRQYESGFGLCYAVGLEWRLWPGYFTRLEWQRYADIEDRPGIDVKRLALGYRF